MFRLLPAVLCLVFISSATSAANVTSATNRSKVASAPLELLDPALSEMSRGVAPQVDLWNPSDSVTLEYVSSDLWSGLNDVAISGHYAYCVSSYGLLVVDISTWYSGVEIGRLDLPGGMNFCITLSGQYAYISRWPDAIQVVDISDPTQPYLVSQVSVPRYPRRMQVSGSKLFLANGYAGLRVFDISNPTNPIFLDSLITPGYVFDVAVMGSYAYLASNDHGLQVVSIANPTSLSSVGSLATPYAAKGLDAAGDYAYIADGYTGMVIIDISNPPSPSQVSTVGLPTPSFYALDVIVDGDYAYQLSYDTNNNWTCLLQMINVSNPVAPFVTDTNDIFSVSINFRLSGGHLFAAGQFDGLFAFEPIPPAIPNAYTTFSMPGRALATCLQGSYAYVARFDVGLQVLDVSDPHNPVRRGLCYLPNEGIGSIDNVTVSGDYAYAGSDDLAIIDISDPDAPSLVSTLSLPYKPGYNTWSDVAVSGDYAYVANRDSGLIVVDVSNPSVPSRVGSYKSMGWIEDIEVSGNYAYLAAYDSGMVVLDVSNPTSPTLLGKVALTGISYIAFDGRYAYAAIGHDSVYVLDCQNPASPTRVGAAPIAASPLGTSTDGSFYYVTTWENILYVYDVSDRANPVLVSTYAAAGATRDVDVHNGYIYLSDYYALAVLDQSVYAGQPPIVSCPPDTSLFLCEPEQVCLSAPTATDPDGDFDSLYVTFGDLSEPTVCFTPDTSGIYTITAIAVDLNGHADTCRFYVTIELNEAPIASCPDNPTVYTSNLSNVCVPGFGYSDPNGNVSSVTVSQGTWSSGSVCMSTTEGTHEIVMVVTDSCGLVSTCSTTVTVVYSSPGNPLTVSLDHVVGSAQSGTIVAGQPVDFYIRVTNLSSYHWMFANRFLLFSPDGAQWENTVPEFTGAMDPGWFDIAFMTLCGDCDGISVDTPGFTGVYAMQSGMPLDFDDVAFKITIGPIDESYIGRTICLDRAPIDNGAEWNWADAVTSYTIEPNWDGPHYFEIVANTNPPNINVAPSSLDFAAAQNGALPEAQTIVISNLGEGTLDWSLNEQIDWLELDPLQGQSDYAEITATINTTNLDPGIHEGVITATSSNAENGPKEIRVTYYVYLDGCADILFRPDVDGWSFANTRENMWPYQWSPADPLENLCECDSGSAMCFPTWELFRDAFGVSQTENSSGVRLPSADMLWQNIKDCWGGSCFGFAVSSFLLYDGYLDLGTEYPGSSSLYEVPLDGVSQSMVNLYWLYQFGVEQQAQIQSHYGTATPNETLLALRAMFSSTATPRDDAVLVFFNNHGSGGHAVNPYACEVDQYDPDISYVYVYDNNAPGDNTRRITFNTNLNTWSYADMPDWGGAEHIFLMDPIHHYAANPILPSEVLPKNRWISTDQAEGSGHVRFFVSAADTVRVQSSLGEIGQVGDSLFGDVSDAYPIIPITGYKTSPIGYVVPDGRWTARVTGHIDSTFNLTMFGDSTVVEYRRRGITPDETASATCPGNDSSMTILNEEAVPIMYSMTVVSIMPDSQIVCELSSISTDPGDSVMFSVSNGSGVVISNFGDATSYDVTVRIVGPTNVVEFHHGSVPIGFYNSHTIIPDWRSFDDSLHIIVDADMTGQPNDTLVLADETVLSCCGQYAGGYTGNTDCDSDGKMNLADITRLIDRIYISKTALCCEENGNVDGDAENKMNLADITKLIDHIYLSKDPTAACQ